MRLAVLAASVLASFCVFAAPKTEVMFFFDAEDYTSDRPNDALRDLANIFTEEGARVHVALVGYLAHELERYGRKDVIAALQPHVMGTQSMYHSKHPNVLELADGADYAAAYRRVRAEEEVGVRLIRRVTGKEPIFAVPPGNSKSYVAMDVYADLGLRFYCDTVCATGDGGNWFANLRHFDYGESMECLIPTPGETPKPVDWKSLLDRIAARPRQILYLHPCMAVNRQFWDGVNYNKTNSCEFGKWRLPQRRAEADTQLYYARLRELIRRLKADGRFTFPTLEEKLSEESPRTAIHMADVKRLAAHMDRGIDAVESPSWSVADVFAASVMFLRGETTHEPGRVHGFLERPFAIERPVTLKVSDLRATAKAIDLSGFLPASIDVGGTRIGPGDFLRATLHALADGGETVTVGPSDPLAALARFDRLRDFHPAGTWVFWPEFKDEFTSDRLRYQVWTWRPVQRRTESVETSCTEPPQTAKVTGSEFSAALWMTVGALPCEAAASVGPLSVSAGADGRWTITFRAPVEDLTGDYVCTTRDAFGRGERHHLEVSYSLMRRRILVRVDGRLQYENDRLVLPQLVTGDIAAQTAAGVKIEDLRTYDFALPTDELALDPADPRRTVAAARRAADAAAKKALFAKWDPSGTKPAAIYAVNPYTAEQFTPYHLPEKGVPGETMRLFAAPDQQVAGSALVVALKAPLTVAGVRVGTLKTKEGVVFPAKAVDIKLVKRWFRCGGAWISYIGDKRQRHLTSDLLVNDDALVKVDEWRERNYLRLEYPEGMRYVDVSDPDAGHLGQLFTAQVPFKDAETLQPVTIGEYGRTQQFLLTFDVGKDVKSGLYAGTVEFVGAGSMRVELNVLPIALPEQGSPYGNLSKSYISLVNCFPPPIGRTLAEKEESIRRAFRAVKGHRLVHTASMWDTPEYLRLGKEEGMIAPDRMFSHRMAWIPDWRSFYPGRPVASLTEADREAAEKVVERQLAPSVDFLSRYFPGRPDTYAIFFSEDSYYYDLVGTQEGQAAVAHRLGYKVYGHTMGNADEVVIAGDLEDLMADTSISSKAAQMWHEAGGEMINYADPFPGSENPAIFRRKLGLEMYKAGYDGDMMHECINLPEPFNEFLGGRYRNFCMGIPQQGGIVWKLAYDGMREAMNDVRYLTALKKAAMKLRDDLRPEVSREAKRQLVWLASIDGKTADPDMVRAGAADRILILNGYLRK